MRGKRSLKLIRDVSYRSWRWLYYHRWVAVALIVAGAALLVFSELVEEMSEGSLHVLDPLILDLLRPYRSDALHDLSVFLSALFRFPWVAILMLPFVGYLIYAKRYRYVGVVIGVPLLTMLFVWLVKAFFSRERPITRVVEEIGYSFPSGHATGATVLYGLLGYVAIRFMLRSTWARTAAVIMTLLLILGTGLARIYLQVHYVSDVAAGWSAGAFILIGTIIAVETWAPASEPGLVPWAVEESD